jgi:hypothetical protein
LDIHTSAQDLREPIMEMAQSAEDFMHQVVEPARRAWRDNLVAGIRKGSFAFDQYDLPQEVLDLLVDMRVYCGDVCSFLNGNIAPGTKDMAMFRNMILYRLLKLPAEATSSGITRPSHIKLSGDVYELTRLGTLIFVYGALYPSPSWHAKRQIIDALRTKVRNVVRQGLDGISDVDVAFLAWLATMSCMMSVGPDIFDREGSKAGHEYEIATGEYSVFAKLLVWCQIRLGLQIYEDLKKEMGRWLWLEEACDEGARKVWDAVKPPLIEGDEEHS